MPELPEVETVKRTLQQVVLGKIIENTEIRYAGVIKKPESEEFIRLLQGKTIAAVDRRGKYLIFGLEGTLVLAVHLRMTGRMVYAEELPEDKHIHVIFRFTDGTFLYYKDLRKFGTLYVLPAEDLYSIRGYALLGPEPLSDDFTLSYFKGALKRSRKKIKQLLLEQEIVAGLGNIYVDEVLHAAKIHPERSALDLSEEQVNALFDAIKRILSESIAHGGTSFSDYVDGFGRQGSHQRHLKVYQREKEECLRCGHKIARIKVGGRSSYHCPQCQK